MSARRFESLVYQSATISNEIEKEQKRPRPDWMRLLRLKKLRLAIKDKLTNLFRNERKEIYFSGQPALAHVRRKRRRN